MDLTIGVVSEGTAYEEVLLEMLDHQGVCYDVVRDDTPYSRAYPVVLISKGTEEALSSARHHVEHRENIIVANEVIDLKGVLGRLSGLVDEKRDEFDLAVNQEEAALIATLKNALSSVNLPLVTKSFWPRRANSCCVLTHDLDWFTYSPFHKAVLGQSIGVLRLPKLAAKSLLWGKNFGWNIDSTIRLEKRFQAKSTFLFQTDYGRENSFVESSLHMLLEAGDEIALHASHSSHKSGTALKSELEAFRLKTGLLPRGIRYHILKFRVPDSWKLESSSGLEYDATFSHTGFFGFRGGVCFPYHPIAEQRLPVVELPTSFMDWTALRRRTRGGRMKDILGKILSSVSRYHGVAVVNFHNTYLNPDTFPDVVGAYEWLLNETTRGGYWITTAAECVEWWNRRAASKPRLQLESGKVVRAQAQVPLVLESEDSNFTLSSAS